MLKFPNCSVIWIFMILLLVVSATRTKKHNIINTIDSTLYCRSNRYQQHCGRLKNFHYFLLSFTHVFQGLINTFLNESIVHDSLVISYSGLEVNNLRNIMRNSVKSQSWRNSKTANVSTYSAKEMIVLTFLINQRYCYLNDAYCLEPESTFSINNTLQGLVQEDVKSRWDLVNYKWKRRTLCAIQDDEKHSTQTSSQGNVFIDDNEEENAGKKTLTDYNAPVIMNDTEDPDSLKIHLRVKRSKTEWDPASSLMYQQDYLKELENSFPRNTYESINENSYDNDISFDTKREIKSHEFSTNYDKTNAPIHETDLSKIRYAQPCVSSSSIKNDEHVQSNTIQTSSDLSKVNVAMDNTGTNNREILSAQAFPKDDSSFLNPRSHHENTEVENLPDDPMLAVDLVRRKRNNYVGVYKKKGVTGTLSKSQNLKGKTDRQLNTRDQNRKLSSLAAANLEAHLLRHKRREKNKRHEKRTKPKKKKKHTGKKQQKNTVRSLANVGSKNTNKVGTPREKKTKGGKSDEGKSRRGIATQVSKGKNKNNFHRRYIESKKSAVRPNSKKLSLANNKNNLGVSLVTPKATVVAGNDVGHLTDNRAPLSAQKGKQTFSETAKLREKRDKNTEATHGFLSKEDELKYYENIREPEPETQQCFNGDKKQRSVTNNGMHGNRAVRSIEEVKELAKKLVTKVNELQNFINVEESRANERREKRTGTRAIDELCSNVSNAYDAFKETPKIVQKCVIPTSHKLSSPAKTIVERKVDPTKITDRGKLEKGKREHSITEKKRSIVRRVPKATPGSTKTIHVDENEKPPKKWGRWTDWSSCSVTCGKGRQIRWRYCLRDCSVADTEMEEKACQLPACPPGKFLGIF